MLTEDVTYWQEVSVSIFSRGRQYLTFRHDLTSLAGVIVKRCSLDYSLWYVQLVIVCTHISDVADASGLWLITLGEHFAAQFW